MMLRSLRYIGHPIQKSVKRTLKQYAILGRDFIFFTEKWVALALARLDKMVTGYRKVWSEDIYMASSQFRRNSFEFRERGELSGT